MEHISVKPGMFACMKLWWMQSICKFFMHIILSLKEIVQKLKSVSHSGLLKNVKF